MQSKLDTLLKKSPLVAILRGITPDEIPAIAQTLLEQSVHIIEVPLNSPDRPLESIRILRDIVGDRGICGAGTVLTLDEVEQVKQAGGELIVSPDCNPEVIKLSLEKGLSSLPGCLTPTEVFSAIRAGATHIKLFPGGDMGPGYIKSMHAVIPDSITTYAVGSVGSENLAGLWRAGVRGFGLGSNIYKPGDSPEIVAGKAKQLREAVSRLTTDS